MRGSRARSLLQLTMVAALLALLVVLVVLQNRWITQLADAEREQLRSSLEKSSQQLCAGFDRELARVFQMFRLPELTSESDLAGELAARLARWRSVAPFPHLVKELLVVTRQGQGVPTLSRFDPRSGRLDPAGWDADLASLRDALDLRGPVPILDPLLPGLILPVNEQRDGPGRRPPRDHVIVRLDRDYIRGQLLPALAADRFGGRDGLAYSLVVRVASRPDLVVFAAGPAVAGGGAAGADISAPLFSLRLPLESAGPPAAAEPTWRDPAPPPPQEGRSGAPGRRPPPPPWTDGERDRGRAEQMPPPQPGADVEAGRWVLEVRHPAGSLAAVVAGARRRNLAVSLMIAALLGIVGVLIVLSTRRAERLARQQMDFVASVSHELRTPLTAMRSAGQNLADGIVTDPARVQSYGALIEREGRRLTELVARVLAFAGIKSGQPIYQMQLVAVRALVEGVLADSRWVLEERRFTVDAEVEEELPAVLGDAAALRQALSNLVDNAMKFGAAARWLAVRASAVQTANGGEVAIAVSDRGLGISRSDLSHIFEPFFRSGDAKVAATTGSGLGLAVVRGIVAAHAGRVTVDSSPGRGSTFTIHLPAASAAGIAGGAA
jgi:signal transduction histidine kinase